MSGLVNLQYCKALTMLQYLEGSGRGMPSYLLNCLPDDMKVSKGLASDKDVRMMRFLMYMC